MSHGECVRIAPQMVLAPEDRPPPLGLEDVAERLRCYGAEVAVDGQSEHWLARQRRWYERQMTPLSRWVAVDPSKGSKPGERRSH